MQVGIDSFIKYDGPPQQAGAAMREFVERMEFADQVGLDVFGVGEHHRHDFLDSAPVVILAAAAARTRDIRLTSAVTVLSAADPVRVFQSFATLDLISNGRAEMVVGRGSFIESFPLFGLRLEDYDSLFADHLDLLLKLRESTHVHWEGRHRPALTGQGVYPRPVQEKLPIWLGVGGTPGSFARAGSLGLPLMVAVIGGETHRFGSLVELYRRQGNEGGFAAEQMRVGLHSFGYVADSSQQAADEFYPGYAESLNSIGKERGWAPPSRRTFNSQLGPRGAYIIGSPQEVIDKVMRHSEALGGISRIMFQMDVGNLPHSRLMRSIELIGTKVAPALRGENVSNPVAGPVQSSLA